MSATTTMERPETSIEMPRISSVLVFLDGRGGTRNGVHLAADAARRQHASLHAVYLDARPPGFSHDQARDVEIADRRAREAENVARAAAANFGVPFEWDIDAGDPVRIARTVIDRARTADLIVVDRENLSESGGDWAVELFAQLPLLSGRPTLFVPARHRANTFGENVLVAWNASRESARAVQDALPLLESARHVMVLGVETSKDPHSGEPIGEPRLAAYLSRHGIRVRLCRSYVVGADVGEIIAARARELGSDLLVMGSCGHGRLGHVVLGRATRHLLENMTVPVLMSH
jgi:nucleotide-binding universal stress UspA family protein